eukprot:scaffold23911_cov70-Phaeocystis_antarctica.AAC.2
MRVCTVVAEGDQGAEDRGGEDQRAGDQGDEGREANAAGPSPHHFSKSQRAHDPQPQRQNMILTPPPPPGPDPDLYPDRSSDNDTWPEPEPDQSPPHRAPPQLTPQRLTPHPQPTLRRSLYCSRPPSSPSQPPTRSRAAPRAPRPRSAA